MQARNGILKAAATALALFAASTATVSAGGFDRERSLKDEPTAEGSRQLQWSFNIGATSDYIFRGISQSGGDPTLQGGIDLTYGIFYVGIWGSGLDFGRDAFNRHIATTEVDYYAGIKPQLGPVTLDLGVIYYTYPRARDTGFELDYVEVKLGASGTVADRLSWSATAFYSPEYTGKTGDVWTLEGGLGYTLPKIGAVTPTIGGLVGTSIGDGTNFSVNGADSYIYWNAGLALAIDKLTIDLRYWDSDIPRAGGFCTGPIFQCDSRFVATAKFTY